MSHFHPHHYIQCLTKSSDHPPLLFQSQYSSQERLHQFPHIPTHDEMRTLNNHFSGGEHAEHPVHGFHGTLCGTQHTYPKHPNHPLAIGNNSVVPATSSGSSSSSPHHLSRKQHLNLLQTEQQGQWKQTMIRPAVQPAPQRSPNPPSLSSQPASETESGYNNDENSAGSGSGSTGSMEKFFIRPRSRSLSSSIRSPVVEHDISKMNQMYKERFPKAVKQMEEKLSGLINEYRNLITTNRELQPVIRFVYNQVSF